MRFTFRLRLPRRFLTLLIPLSFIALIFILPLNRSGDRVVDDIEDYIHIPHTHLTSEPKHPHKPPPKGAPKPWGEQLFGSGKDRKRRMVKKPTGVAEVPLEEIGANKLGKHPLEALMIDARAKANLLESQIPTTLDAAVRLYTKLNKGAQPPAGFDKWFKFCVDSKLVPWPHPGAHHSILPYMSLPGSRLKERLKSLDDQRRVVKFEFRDGELFDSGADTYLDKYRAVELRKVLEPIMKLVPDLIAYYNVDDLPARTASYEVQSQSRDLATAGQLWDPTELSDLEARQMHQTGYPLACPPTSPVRRADTASNDMVLEMENLEEGITEKTPRTFIYSASQSLDLCEHLENFDIHGNLIASRPPALPLVPLISYAKMPTYTDVLGVATDQINLTMPARPWSSKTDHRVLWRGSATGISHNKLHPWQRSHRERLHLLANPPLGSTQRLTTVVLAQNPSTSALELRSFPTSELNERFLDMGLTKEGAVIQCNKPDGTCAEMTHMFEETAKPRVEAVVAQRYRYNFDVDGNGWSSRFRRLLTSGSVVLKTTVYEEWYSDLLVPWYHYVPVQVSYNDLYDIMAFFEGVDDEDPGRSDLASEIGANGRKFALERWAAGDVQAYMLLLLLEYSRAMSEDRDAATFAS